MSALARAVGMQTLRASALLKARRGETTFEEAVRVTHADTRAGHACPACERAVEKGMVRCPWCGTGLATDRCPHCERRMEAEWAVCPWCVAA